MFLFCGKSDILSSDGVQIFQIHSRAFSDYIVQKIFRCYRFSKVFRPFPFRLKTDSDIRFRAKSDGCQFIRAFSDRLPTCSQMEVKLSDEIQINVLKTFQWFFKACLDIRWFEEGFQIEFQ